SLERTLVVENPQAEELGDPPGDPVELGRRREGHEDETARTREVEVRVDRAAGVAAREVLDQADRQDEIGLDAQREVEDGVAVDADAGVAQGELARAGEALVVVVHEVVEAGLEEARDLVEEAAVGAAELDDLRARAIARVEP